MGTCDVKALGELKRDVLAHSIKLLFVTDCDELVGLFGRLDLIWEEQLLKRLHRGGNFHLGELDVALGQEDTTGAIGVYSTAIEAGLMLNVD